MKAIPAMHRVLADERITAYESSLGRDAIKRAANEVFGRARTFGDGTYDTIVADLAELLERLRRQVPARVINATGILLHTNLGRAPLAAEALDAVADVSRGYSSLEYDLQSGERGSRYDGVASIVNDVTGAEASLVVNNCAAAVLLVLDTFAKGREVIVARSELVEIGGGFRVPEVLERSGATLVEVGTTNRVYPQDFERALSPRTALILRTHPSNYRLEGFTHGAGAREIAALGHRAGVPVVEDLGSGAMVELQSYGVENEPTVREALDDGMSLVTFSGDKLLGGPQAGIVVGRAPLVSRLRSNPLLRALRIDKMTLAALAATLRLHGNAALRERLPVYRMLCAALEELRSRGRAYEAALRGAAVVESDAYVGGGVLPQHRLASIAVAVASEKPQTFAACLRAESPPVVARVADGRVLLDLRTVAPEDDAVVIAACRNCLT